MDRGNPPRGDIRVVVAKSLSEDALFPVENCHFVCEILLEKRKTQISDRNSDNRRDKGELSLPMFEWDRIVTILFLKMSFIGTLYSRIKRPVSPRTCELEERVI